MRLTLNEEQISDLEDALSYYYMCIGEDGTYGSEPHLDHYTRREQERHAASIDGLLTRVSRMKRRSDKKILQEMGK